MAAEYNCAKCDKSYVRRGNLEKHMAKHTELEGGVQQGDTPLFADIVLPEEFPDLDEDYLALMDVAEVNFDDPFCGRCSDESDEMKNLKMTNNKLLRKVIALEKSLKIARKLNKDAKNETESARFMLEKATRESLVEKQKASTHASQEVIEVVEEAKPAKEESVSEVECILHQCKTCDYKTKNKFAMASHIALAVHTGRPSPCPKKKEQTVLLRTLQCEKCEVKCLDEAELKHHIASEHNGRRPCRYGDSCRFMAAGNCKFGHREVVQEGWEEVRRRGRRTPTTHSRVQPCRYDNLCTKGRFCRFTHSMWVWGRAPMPTQSSGNRFEFLYNMEEDFPVLNSITRKY